MAWKRMVQGVREMCDACETNLFNFHWSCGRCGFVVCAGCYSDPKSSAGEWVGCTNGHPHEADKLILTQIITGDTLEKSHTLMKNCSSGNTKLSSCSKTEESTCLRDLIGNSERSARIPDVIKRVEKLAQTEQQEEEAEEDLDEEPRSLEHFVRRSDIASDVHFDRRRKSLAGDTATPQPSTSGKWFCDGRALRLDFSCCSLEAFQAAWQRHLPVVVGDMTRKMDVSLWSPSTLSDTFGEVRRLKFSIEII